VAILADVTAATRAAGRVEEQQLKQLPSPEEIDDLMIEMQGMQEDIDDMGVMLAAPFPGQEDTDELPTLGRTPGE
jgi:hypothetical protein